MKNLTDFRKTVETGVDPGLWWWWWWWWLWESNRNVLKQKREKKSTFFSW